MGTEIEDVLMHMGEGMKYSRMLRAETSRDKPRNKFLRTYANRAFEHLKKSELSDELTRKLTHVEQLGNDLSEAAKTAAGKLSTFAKLGRSRVEEEGRAGHRGD